MRGGKRPGQGRPKGRLNNDTANWHDTGCRFAPSCLNCPFPFCCYDLPNPLTFKHDLRALSIYALFSSGMTPQEIAFKYNVSARTVWRYIRRVNSIEFLRECNYAHYS